MVSWLSVFNPTPHFPDYTGPYSVGTVDVEIASHDLSYDIAHSDTIPSSVAFRCFYPCGANETSTRPVHWIQGPQRKTVNAYARFLGVGSVFSTAFSYFSHLLYYVTIPARRNAPILASPHPSKRWPVLVFSHGLGGSRNAYSHLCGSLASHGLVVVAADHRDGSSPISYVRATEKTEAQTVEYRRVPHKPSPEVYNARDEQLRIRISELSLIHEALLRMDKGDDDVKNLDPNKDRKRNDLDILPMFRDMLDVHTPGTITWAGHSMGAATTVQFVKSIFYSQEVVDSPILTQAPSNTLKAQITSNTPIILLDLWAMPINSPATASLRARPMPCFSPSGSGGTPLLAILSEAFFKWRSNLDDVKRILSDPRASSSRRPQASIFYPVASAHLSQSDFGILFPNITKYLAKADEPERTLRLNVRAILEVLRRGGVAVAETSAVDMELEEREMGMETEKGLEKTDVGRVGDWKILSRKQGVVRGWVALGPNDNTQAVEAAEKVTGTMGRGQKESAAETIGDDELRGAAVDCVKA